MCPTAYTGTRSSPEQSFVERGRQVWTGKRFRSELCENGGDGLQLCPCRVALKTPPGGNMWWAEKRRGFGQSDGARGNMA